MRVKRFCRTIGWSILGIFCLLPIAVGAPLPHENAPYNPSDQLQATSNEEQVTHFNSSSTYWTHNGSTVLLETDRAVRRITYESPRPGMVEAGAMKGSMLFLGSATGQAIRGTAYIFNRRCGRFPYAVEGSMTSDRCGPATIEMRGMAPRPNSNCSVSSFKQDVLVFHLVRFDSLPGTDGLQCE